jgi:hypothetical protein
MICGCCRPRPTRLQRLWKHLTTVTVEIASENGKPFRFRTFYVRNKAWYRAVLWVLHTPRRIAQHFRPTKVGSFDKVSFPMINRVSPNLITTDLLSVQPMASLDSHDTIEQNENQI